MSTVSGSTVNSLANNLSQDRTAQQKYLRYVGLLVIAGTGPSDIAIVNKLFQVQIVHETLLPGI